MNWFSFWMMTKEKALDGAEMDNVWKRGTSRGMHNKSESKKTACYQCQSCSLYKCKG